MKLFAFGMLAIGGYVAGLALFTPAEAEARYRRAAAATSCFATTTLDVDFDSPGALSNPFVKDVDPTVSRSSGRFTVSRAPGGSLGALCNVPTDSYLAHQNMDEVHVSGYHDSSNGNATRFRACTTSWTNGTWSCGGAEYVPHGNFNEVITVSSRWNSDASYPIVAANLDVGDRLYGLYFTD